MSDDDSLSTKIAVVQHQVSYIKEDLDRLEAKINLHYTSDDEFEPIKKIVYGIVTLILIAVVGALLALILQNGI